jgi:hypothetical protein
VSEQKLWPCNRRPAGTVYSAGHFLYPIMTTRLIPLQKLCIACRVPLPANQFSAHGGHKDGLQSRCKSCTNERSKSRRLNLDTPKLPRATKTLPKPKPVPKVIPSDPEPIVDIPGIFEVQNRGRGYTSYNFTSPIDQGTFTFSSFKEARAARESMRAEFRQLAAYQNTHRQSTGKRNDEDEDETL